MKDGRVSKPTKAMRETGNKTLQLYNNHPKPVCLTCLLLWESGDGILWFRRNYFYRW